MYTVLTYILNLPVSNTDPQQELLEIVENLKSKLSLENGLVQLPDPLKLSDGWIQAPANFPDMTYDIC